MSGSAELEGAYLAFVGELVGRPVSLGARASELQLESADVVEMVLWLEHRGVLVNVSVLEGDFGVLELIAGPLPGRMAVSAAEDRG